MTDLTSKIDRALEITRAATPGPWTADRRGYFIHKESDANAIFLWRAVTEQALELAKAMSTASKYFDDCGIESHLPPDEPECVMARDFRKALAALNAALEKAEIE